MSDLFLYNPNIQDSYLNKYRKEGINITLNFLKCADEQLRKSFEKITPIEVNKNICV